MTDKLKLVLPKGRLQEKVVNLLNAIGIDLVFSTRSYRPVCSDPEIEIKLLKPQNIPPLLALGRHDAGFAGHDWVLENGLEDQKDITEMLNLGFNKIRLVAAVSDDLIAENRWRAMRLVVASEYVRLAERYIEEKKLNAVLLKSYGATEALPPEDADMIIDNTSTGSTLVANRLTVVDEILRSTTRFLASQNALNNPKKQAKLEQLRMLMRSTLNAQNRVMLEMNVSKNDLERLVSNLPCMRFPTVAPLYGEDGYAVKVAVQASEVPKLIPELVARGARDLLEYRLEKLVP